MAKSWVSLWRARLASSLNAAASTLYMLKEWSSGVALGRERTLGAFLCRAFVGGLGVGVRLGGMDEVFEFEVTWWGFDENTIVSLLMSNSTPYRFIHNLPKMAACWPKSVMSIDVVSSVWPERTKLGYRAIVIGLLAICPSYPRTLLGLAKGIGSMPSSLQIPATKLRSIKAYSIIPVSIRNLIE